LPPGRLYRVYGILAAAFLSGCPGPPDQEAVPPAASSAPVTLAVPAGHGLSEAWQVAAAEWEATSGARCTFEEVDLTETPLPPESAALAVVPLQDLATLLDSGWPATIDEASPGYPLTREVFDGLRRALSVRGGDAVAVPLACPVLACYYRADLLEAAGLSPPNTWDDYGRILTALPDWAPGLTAVEPWNEDFRATMFLARAVPAALHPDNFSLYLDVETGEPLIHDPPFTAALEEAIRVAPLLDPRSRELGPADCIREVLEGRCALAIGAHDPRPQTDPRSDSEPSRSDESLRVGIAMLPGAARVYQRQTGEWQPAPEGSAAHRVTLIGFDGWMVCAAAQLDAEARTAAWQLWTTLDSPELSGPAQPWAGAVVRSSRLADVLQHPSSGFRSDEWRAQVQTAADSLNSGRVVFDLPLPERQRFRDTLAAQLSTALAGEKAAQEALQAVRDDWNSIIDELGRRRVVNVYRACSGLSRLPEP
jgi:multiple sugar transport system substrate-binding protein